MAIAIIAEYNPFHNGHIYQINYVKKHFPNDKIYVILSGNFVQRGEPAVASFEQRKQIALAYGVDEVIRLPFKYATQAAHIFAKGAIEIIAKHNIDKLIFGSESNNIENLYFLANIIKNNLEEYNYNIKKNLKQGLSFPNSAAKSLSDLTGQAITLPNDILGFEYIKQIVFNNYNIQAFSIKRTVNFHSLEANNNFASATLLRQMIYKNIDISQFSPMKIETKPLQIQDLYPQFQKVVINTPVDKLKQIHLVSEGMENLFKKHIDAPTFEEFINRTNSKRYTTSRIKRVMLYVLLEIYNIDDVKEETIQLTH
ncbi:nucleotidyltransferase [Mesomycoplasma conjunctivae]|uniref:nucleotidyltransferase n=1 Tax=Mesomycoplasma conjunctivae TaxID=45361 RepID=UPI003DA483AD